MLDEHAGWIAERFTRHHGNADVVRQDLVSELGVVASLRTVERAVCHLRRELAAATLATVRFETPPGRQLQIDFGQRRIVLEDGEVDKVFLFVATLGYARTKPGVWFACKDEIADWALKARAGTSVYDRGAPTVSGLPGSRDGTGTAETT